MGQNALREGGGEAVRAEAQGHGPSTLRAEHASFAPHQPSDPRHAARDLLDAVENAIDIYRFGAERRLGDERSFDPFTMLDEVFELARPQARAVGTRLKLSFGVTGFDPPRVVGDLAALRATLVGLVEGAAKIWRGAELTIQPTAVERDREVTIEIAVKIGPFGAPQHKRGAGKKAASPPARERWVDSELSFAISDDLSRVLDGTLGDLDDVELDFTVTARFRLPIARVEAAFSRPAAHQTLSDDALRDLKILVVEDIDLNRELICMLLAPYGCETDGVADGWAALDAIDAKAYDIILMDMNMPKMDGFEAIRRIRAREDERGKVPILAVTGRALSVDIAKIRMLGASGYLAKPFISVDMVAAIVGCLPNRSAAAAA